MTSSALPLYHKVNGITIFGSLHWNRLLYWYTIPPRWPHLQCHITDSVHLRCYSNLCGSSRVHHADFFLFFIFGFSIDSCKRLLHLKPLHLLSPLLSLSTPWRLNRTYWFWHRLDGWWGNVNPNQSSSTHQGPVDIYTLPELLKSLHTLGRLFISRPFTDITALLNSRLWLVD